jgi:hypothetical protein
MADATPIGDWITQWCEQNRIGQPATWVTWWQTVSLSEPAIPLILFALTLLSLLASYVGWKFKGSIDRAKIKGMEAQIDAANQRLLLAEEQRAAGANVEVAVQALGKRIAELSTRLEAGAKLDELAMRLDIVTQMLAKLTSANDELQRTFVQSEPIKRTSPQT